MVPFIGHFRIDVGVPLLCGLLVLILLFITVLYATMKGIHLSIHHKKTSSVIIVLLAVLVGPFGGKLMIETNYLKLELWIKEQIESVLIGKVSEHDRMNGFRSYLSTRHLLRGDFDRWSKPRHMPDVLSKDECQMVEDYLFQHADKLIHVDTQVNTFLRSFLFILSLFIPLILYLYVSSIIYIGESKFCKCMHICHDKMNMSDVVEIYVYVTIGWVFTLSHIWRILGLSSVRKLLRSYSNLSLFKTSFIL
jgi:hypothetical protein